MGTNGNGQFLENELVHRKVKIGNEWQTKTFPVVGGRLRIVHESHDHLSIQTEIIKLEPDFVVVRAATETKKGKFSGTGTASTQRDARLAHSLVELAETRAIARALRFSGTGCEYTGAEEVSHVQTSEPESEQTSNKVPSSEFHQDKRNGKPETKPGANGQATSAQVKALWALTKKARYTQEDIEAMLRPLNAANFQDLTREAASQLITSLQSRAAA